ncbi:hypothetical protein [Streptomyces sp. NPDC058989]|uniref:hypothetical protein n=1 Tax=Streptomyces sp. NPDC058989 TaxID=3346686 RepID=UPI0036BA8CC6
MAKAVDPAAARERVVGLGHALGLAGMLGDRAVEPLRGIAPAKVIAGLDGG